MTTILSPPFLADLGAECPEGGLLLPAPQAAHQQLPAHHHQPAGHKIGSDFVIQGSMLKTYLLDSILFSLS